MAAMKQLQFDAAELAFKVEANIPNRTQAIHNWCEFVSKFVARLDDAEYQKEAARFMNDTFDQIADRNGDAWELLSNGEDWETLVSYYSPVKAN